MLPKNLTKSRPGGKDKVALGSKWSHARPSMSSDSKADPQLLNQLCQRFSARLRGSEHASKRVEKAIKERRQGKDKDGSNQAAAPPGSLGKTTLYLDKLKRKEAE